MAVCADVFIMFSLCSDRAVYFACYSKAKEQFNGIFVPNSNIVHIFSAGSAGTLPLPVGGESMCCAQQPFLGIRNELSAFSPSEIIFVYRLYVRADKITCLRSVCSLFLSLWPLKLFILPQHVHVPRMLIGFSASFQGIFMCFSCLFHDIAF